MKRLREVLSFLIIVLLVFALLYAYLILGAPTAPSSLLVWVLVALVFLALLPFYRSQYRNQAVGSRRSKTGRVLPNDYGYQETRQIVLGKSQINPLLDEFSDWMMKSYYVKLLNFQFSKLEGSKTNTYRLMLIIENAKEYQRTAVQISRLAEDERKQIIAEFQRLAKKYRLSTDEQLTDIFVVYHDFSDDAMTIANRKAAKEVRHFIKHKYRVVWDVSPIFWNSVVFYYSDFDIAINENKGITAAITNDYYSILKKYDELNYFTKEDIMLKFDSKENFDKNYHGNFYYYSH